jgi:hypothetical protein
MHVMDTAPMARMDPITAPAIAPVLDDARASGDGVGGGGVCVGPVDEDGRLGNSDEAALGKTSAAPLTTREQRSATSLSWACGGKISHGQSKMICRGPGPGSRVPWRLTWVPAVKHVASRASWFAASACWIDSWLYLFARVATFTDRTAYIPKAMAAAKPAICSSVWITNWPTGGVTLATWAILVSNSRRRQRGGQAGHRTSVCGWKVFFVLYVYGAHVCAGLRSSLS